MVVLLAIAGGVAAVLLTRGGEATNQLEQTASANVAQIYRIENKSICESSGGTFYDGTTEFVIDETVVNVDINNDGDTSDKTGATAKCKPR